MDIEGLKSRFNEQTGYLLAGYAALSACALFIAVTYLMAAGSERLVNAKKAELEAFAKMKQEYVRERADIEPYERRLTAAQAKESTAAIIQEIAAQTGAGTISFKPVGDVPEKGYAQSGVEAKLDGLTLNQMANLLYRVENHSNLLLVKDVTVKSHFDNPGLWDVTMQVFVLTKPHG